MPGKETSGEKIHEKDTSNDLARMIRLTCILNQPNPTDLDALHSAKVCRSTVGAYL